MKQLRPIWNTQDALGIASIIEVATNGAFNLEQDIKGRWHVWSTPATDPDKSDHVARSLEADVYA